MQKRRINLTMTDEDAYELLSFLDGAVSGAPWGIDTTKAERILARLDRLLRKRPNNGFHRDGCAGGARRYER